MNSVDELDGEIRRMVTELGDAAGPPPGLHELRSRSEPRLRPHRGLVVAACIVALVGAGIYGLVALSDEAPEPAFNNQPVNIEGTLSVPPAPTEPITSQDERAAAPAQFAQVIESAVPDGFTTLYIGGPRPTAVAYNVDGVRLEIVVDLDNADEVRRQVGDGFVETDQGDITPDGAILLTDAGDVVQANFTIAGCLCRIEMLDDLRADASNIVTAVSSSLDDDIRSELQQLRGPTVDTAALRADVKSAVQQRLGTVTGERVIGQGDFNFSNRTFPESGEAVTAVEVVRTTSGRLADGTTRSADNVVSASQWANGLQVIVSSVAQDAGQPPATETEVQTLLNDVVLLLQAEQSTSDMPIVVEIVDISYMCGANDDLWAEVVVVASEPVSVFAQFDFDGTAHGRSEVVDLTPGEQERIGFYPRRPNEAFQKTGSVEIFEAGATTPSATIDAVPELPDGVSCG